MKPVDEESNTTPACMSRTKRIICLVIFLLICGGLSWAAINLHSASPRAEKPLSDVKVWVIESVEQMPYVQGEHKQEILKQINEAKTEQEIGKIVSQAQKDNDEIRVLVASQRLESHDCENGGNK